jgi:hypothetical protein
LIPYNVARTDRDLEHIIAPGRRSLNSISARMLA